MSDRSFVEVAPGVVVATSRRYTTTSTVVVRDGAALLVDPAWTRDELEQIAGWLTANSLTVTAGVSTHAHHDHLLWQPAFGDAPRWASQRSVECAAEWHDEMLAMLDDDLVGEWPDPLLGVRALDGDIVPEPFGGAADETVRFVVHDGHAPGHTAVWLPERGVLLAGDMLSDIELPLPFNPDDLPAYLAALDTLAPVVAAATVLVPGHGHPTDRPLERLDADRRYLDDLLQGRDPDDPRRALKGMDEAHAKNVALARGVGSD